MQDLQKHEQFEMEVLDFLSKEGFLNQLIFGGGTCLRLCYGLNRYSVDLDFWSSSDFDTAEFKKMTLALGKNYEITDKKAKHFSYLLELRSTQYPKRLKIEIRRGRFEALPTELTIAFSIFSPLQVRLTTFTLQHMALAKVEALLNRGEIRDAYDLEFLYKKGQLKVKDLDNKKRAALIKCLNSFKPKDFKVKLGSLLEAEERAYYAQAGFKLLENALK